MIGEVLHISAEESDWASRVRESFDNQVSAGITHPTLPEQLALQQPGGKSLDALSLQGLRAWIDRPATLEGPVFMAAASYRLEPLEELDIK